MSATITDIYIAPNKGLPMEPVLSIQALTGVGLEGDRYARKMGTYSKFPGAHDVTLFETEAIWDFFSYSGIELHPAQTRRNFFTEGVRLMDLIGQEFSIGSVRFLGLRPCPPCLYLSQLLKMPILLKGLARSGGIYAQILTDGLVTVGDALVPKASEIVNVATNT